MDHRPLFFLHVPKTAGRYVVSVALKHELRPGSRARGGHPRGRLFYGGHAAVRRDLAPSLPGVGHCALDEPGWASSVRFAVLRNPFDLLVSMFADGWPYGASFTHERFREFDDFARAFCDPDFPWRIPEQHRDLWFQLKDEQGACPLDHLLHQERLDDELEAMCRPLGLEPVRAGVHLASRHGDCRDHRFWYSDALRELVERRCAAELAWAGYDFDGLATRRAA